MKIQEVQIGKDYAEIQGTVTGQPGAVETITSKKDGKSIPKQVLIIDGVAGDFWCGKQPMGTPDFGKQVTLLAKATTYNGQIQYNFRRPGAAGSRTGGFRDYKAENSHKNRSVALSYCLSKEHLGMSWSQASAAVCLQMAELIETGKIPGGLVGNRDGEPYNYDDAPPPSDDDIPF